MGEKTRFNGCGLGSMLDLIFVCLDFYLLVVAGSRGSWISMENLFIYLFLINEG